LPEPKAAELDAPAAPPIFSFHAIFFAVKIQALKMTFFGNTSATGAGWRRPQNDVFRVNIQAFQADLFWNFRVKACAGATERLLNRPAGCGKSGQNVRASRERKSPWQPRFAQVNLSREIVMTFLPVN
jgi:hypothetical protein